MATARSPIFRDPPTYRESDPRRSHQPTVCIRPATPPPPNTTDAALLAILDGPLDSSETAMSGFARKERELGTTSARLAVLEVPGLQARLANPTAGDDLAPKFPRLTVDRRTPLLCFLADARRREAIAQGARCP